MHDKIRKLLDTWNHGGLPNPLKPLQNENYWLKQLYQLFFVQMIGLVT